MRRAAPWAVLLMTAMLLAPACSQEPADGTGADGSAAAPGAAAEPATESPPAQPDTSSPTAEPGTPSPRGEAPPEPFVRSEFDASAVPEASGIAVSRDVAGRAYLLDDGRGIFLLDIDSGALQPLPVAAAGDQPAPALRDLEDLAVGPCGPGDARSCVYVGDIGDNRRDRDVVEILRFPEPAEPPGTTAVAVDVIRLSYPNGAEDAEALIVDDAGTPLVISKARFDEAAGVTGPTRVYAAPGFGSGELADLGPLEVPEPADGLLAAFVGNVVTGADRLGDRVLLRTYDSVLLLEPPAGTSADPATLASWVATELASPLLPQSEAVGFLRGGEAYVTVSEGGGAVWQGAVPPRR